MISIKAELFQKVFHKYDTRPQVRHGSALRPCLLPIRYPPPMEELQTTQYTQSTILDRFEEFVVASNNDTSYF